jgi:hypothetical protein
MTGRQVHAMDRLEAEQRDLTELMWSTGPVLRVRHAHRPVRDQARHEWALRPIALALLAVEDEGVVRRSVPRLMTRWEGQRTISHVSGQTSNHRTRT